MADEQPNLSEEQVEKATNLLDIRKIIGALLAVYGVLLLAAGFFGSDADKEQAAGVNINLWVGLALLVAAGLMLAWGFTRPLIDELEDAEEEPDVTGGEQAAQAGR